jgi:hypothetical protein
MTTSTLFIALFYTPKACHPLRMNSIGFKMDPPPGLFSVPKIRKVIGFPRSARDIRKSDIRKSEGD